jgi:hypothetical protein
LNEVQAFEELAVVAIVRVVPYTAGRLQSDCGGAVQFKVLLPPIHAH